MEQGKNPLAVRRWSRPCAPRGRLEDMEGDIYDPESVVEVLHCTCPHCTLRETDDRRPILMTM